MYTIIPGHNNGLLKEKGLVFISIDTVESNKTYLSAH